ncbi:oxidoreductase, short chain dehydrogenase/reductase family protein [Dictyocaulus viviparus]|uniref:Oxidoreductase, short chain dehydrogenase/reductase family protein n=1 Tax=Dictyocaulus viviparus TaxID=29172 RepID=A0A0D8XSF8_DICVI|nr:oxidoreductase, short chain dehydrogenase/reductase family protein [Dictyocaulus viviparus]
MIRNTTKLSRQIIGQIVLITGAGNGLGRHIAEKLALHQCILVLWDVDDEGNQETRSICEALGAKAYSYKVNISNRDEIYLAASRVLTEVGVVRILVNNAGILREIGDFLLKTDEVVEMTIRVNMMAHIWSFCGNVLGIYLIIIPTEKEERSVVARDAAGMFGLQLVQLYILYLGLPHHYSCGVDNFVSKKDGSALSCMAKAFLPSMIEHDDGHFVCICSMSGIVGAKDIVDYSASKFGAFGFQLLVEKLYIVVELIFSSSKLRPHRDFTRRSWVVPLQDFHRSLIGRPFHTPITLNSNVINLIKVDHHKSLFPNGKKILVPEKVAEEIVYAILKRKRILLLPKKANLLYAVKGVLPRRSFQRLLLFIQG